MKRFMTLLLIASLSVFAVGCGAEKDKDKDKDGDKDKSKTPATDVDIKKGEKADPNDLGHLNSNDDKGSSTTSGTKDKNDVKKPDPDDAPDLTIPEFDIENPFKEDKDKDK